MHSYSNHLLLPYSHLSDQWLSTDSHQLYLHNLETQPQSWIYRHSVLRYAYNTNGYRTKEWTQIDWAQSRLLMGCSLAMGVGLDQSQIITAGVEHAVNLGQPGISIANILYNSLRLIDHGIRPRSVDIIVPDLGRSVYWARSDWVDLTPHDLIQRGSALAQPVQDYYHGFLSLDPMAELSSLMLARALQGLWRSHAVDCELWSITDLPGISQLSAVIDLARDQSQGHAHPGPKTAAQWRSQIFP